MKYIPYGRQCVDVDDIAAVIEVLRSDLITTGPKVDEFEKQFAAMVGAREAVAVSSGTAALHATIYALGIGPGDEVILPPMTFAATANAVVYQGGTPVFVDVDAATLLLDPSQVESKLTARTKAIIAVDYAGQPCDYDALQTIAKRHGHALVADACHSLGGGYKGRAVGTLGDLNAFSFHPVKPITTAEGGMVTTDVPELARRMRAFRNHGISRDYQEREKIGAWFYEMVDLGYNYRLNDLQCALGISQLRKLAGWIARRQEIAQRYDEAFQGVPSIKPLTVRPDVSHAYHLYVLEVCEKRDQVFAALRAERIGVNVHYIPVHLHPFYRKRFGTGPGLCPVAERAYERIVTLPVFPRMADEDVTGVIAAVRKVVEGLT